MHGPDRQGGTPLRRPLRAGAFLALLAAAPGSRAAADSSTAQPALIPLGGAVLFSNIEGPLSFITTVARELPKGAALHHEARGESCQHALSIPLLGVSRMLKISGALGEGGYDKALGKIRERHPDFDGLFDVKMDLHFTSVLGLYTRLCVEVEGRGFTLPGSR